MKKLTAIQAQRSMKRVPLWTKRRQLISRTFVFADFVKAMAFVNRVAVLAESRDHHPDIDVRWNKVTLGLSTHSAGGLTTKDFSLARLCDRLVPKLK
jgi:4a-hydroxytetrahydrobiopterin dehydratase